MRLMISGASTTVSSLARFDVMRRHLGAMVTPNTGNGLEWVCGLGLPWCVDNAAFDAARFDTRKYLALLRRVAAATSQPAFVTVPDQAPGPSGDNSHCHGCTAHLFERWFRVLEFEGLDRLPLAFVSQNGLDDAGDLPWDLIEAVFIGGDDEFKLGDFVMSELIPEARRRGKWVHMGRVNGRRRLRHAVMADCDSVDGSSLSRFAGTYVVRFVGALVLALRERDRLDEAADRLEGEIRRLDASVPPDSGNWRRGGYNLSSPNDLPEVAPCRTRSRSARPWRRCSSSRPCSWPANSRPPPTPPPTAESSPTPNSERGLLIPSVSRLISFDPHRLPT